MRSRKRLKCLGDFKMKNKKEDSLLKIVCTGKFGRKVFRWLATHKALGADLLMPKDERALRKLKRYDGELVFAVCANPEKDTAFLNALQEGCPKDGLVVTVMPVPAFKEDSEKTAFVSSLKGLKAHSVLLAENAELKGESALAAALGICLKRLAEGVSLPNIVSFDFSDVKSVLRQRKGFATIGFGTARTSKLQEATAKSLSNSLLTRSMRASGAILHITGGPELSLDEIQDAGSLVCKKLGKDANVIWGARLSEKMKGKVEVFTMLTGIK